MFYNKPVALLLVLCDTVFCATSVSSVPSEVPDKRSDWHRIRFSGGGPVTTEDDTRTRRGIVLVDEDFNVSPEPGVNQGWSDGGSEVTETKHTKAESTGEGSGESPELEGISTSEYASFKTSPGKLEMTSTGIKLTSETDVEGSGEEIATKSTEHPTETFIKPIPNSCLNSTCDSQEITVLPGHTEVVPEGTNLSLTCIQVNATEPGTLQWYKRNESINALLQASDRKLELTFDITQSLVEHSGTYLCILSSRDSCCHRQLEVRVYEVPNYRYHLIIIGVVAAVSLFSCLLLAVCRNFKAKKYEVQLELQNMEADCIYKM